LSARGKVVGKSSGRGAVAAAPAVDPKEEKLKQEFESVHTETHTYFEQWLQRSSNLFVRTSSLLSILIIVIDTYTKNDPTPV